jgi:hypothetical protein
MAKLEARNLEMLHLSDGGLSSLQIAAQFGISTQRVFLILKRERRYREARESVPILDSVLTSDGINKPVPARLLMDSLGFNARSARAIACHFSENGVESISLLQLAEFLIPDGLSLRDVSNCWDALPALRVKGIGPDGFLTMVARLSFAADIGEVFRKEWGKRKAVLLENEGTRVFASAEVLRMWLQ